MLNRSKKIAVAGILLILLVLVAYHFVNTVSTDVTVYYSLDQKQNDQILIDLIDDADEYVYFAIYTFTKGNIADALIQAHNRGVDVRGIADRGQSNEDFQQPTIQKLITAGIPVQTQKHPDGIMHIKALVTEQAFASGSYNWTSSATTVNDEVLEVGRNKSLHSQYLRIIQKILADNEGSVPVVSGETADLPSDGDLKTYTYAEAGGHIGETALVTGTIVEVFTSATNTTFLDYCANYKTCPFTAVIFSSDKSKFPNLFQYQGKEIMIKGEIKTYQGRAEIILSDPSQIIK